MARVGVRQYRLNCPLCRFRLIWNADIPMAHWGELVQRHFQRRHHVAIGMEPHHSIIGIAMADLHRLEIIATAERLGVLTDVRYRGMVGRSWHAAYCPCLIVPLTVWDDLMGTKWATLPVT